MTPGRPRRRAARDAPVGVVVSQAHLQQSAVIDGLGLGYRLASVPRLGARRNVEVFEWRRIVGQHPADGGPVVPGILEARPLPLMGERIIFLSASQLGACGSSPVYMRAQRSCPVGTPHRVGQAEGVDIGVALSVVHPVVAGVELAPQLSVAGELPGHGVPQDAAALRGCRHCHRGSSRGASCRSSRNRHRNRPSPATPGARRRCRPGECSAPGRPAPPRPLRNKVVAGAGANRGRDRRGPQRRREIPLILTG